MTEFLTNNWFNLVTLTVLIVGWFIRDGVSKARREQENKQVIDRLDEIETTLDSDVKALNAHVANSDIHVNHMMMKLFDERFDYIKKEQENTRQDIQRIEQILTKT